MVEMLMVFPLLLLLIFGSVELCRAWFTLQATSTAVREGARAAAVVTAANMVAVGNARIDAVLSAAGITPVSRGTTTPSTGLPTGCSLAAGAAVPCDTEVVATATVTFQTFFPVLIPRLQTVTMTQTARMRSEGG